jgi:uncharacterized membrane protein YcjF (UPF0283 family)
MLHCKSSHLTTKNKEQWYSDRLLRMKRLKERELWQMHTARIQAHRDNKIGEAIFCIWSASELHKVDMTQTGITNCQ